MLVQHHKTQNGFSVRRLRARIGVLPLLLAFFFAFTGITSALHQHGGKTYQTAAAKVICVSEPTSHATDAVSAASEKRLDTHCVLCDWVHQPRTPAINVTPAFSLPTLVAVPAPPTRRIAFFAARFADRSAARAPPAV